MVGYAFTFRIFVSLRRIGNCDGKVSKQDFDPHKTEPDILGQCSVIKHYCNLGQSNAAKLILMKTSPFTSTKIFWKTGTMNKTPTPLFGQCTFFEVDWVSLKNMFVSVKNIRLILAGAESYCEWYLLGPSNGVTAIVARTQHNIYVHVHSFIYTYIY